MEVIMSEEINKAAVPITERVPWAKASESSDIPLHLDYYEASMFEAIENVAKKYPNQVAFDFMGKEIVREVGKMKSNRNQVFPGIKALQWLYLATLDGRRLNTEPSDRGLYINNHQKRIVR